MRVALAAKHSSPTHGGVERFSTNLARALLEAGHDVAIIAASWDAEIEGVSYYKVPVVRKPAWARVLSFSHGCRKIAEKENFDILYGLTQIFPQDVHRMGGGIYRYWMELKYPSLPLRWLQRLIHPVHIANLYLERQIYKPQNYIRIVANSKLCKKQLSDFYGVSPDDIHVIYNGVDHAVFNAEARGRHRPAVRSELGVAESQKTLLFVSSNWKRKGLDTIFTAMAEREDCELIVVGRGKIGLYNKKAQKLGISSRVHFTGAVRDVERYYGAADVFVLPTQYDPAANVCLEAMACGLPVITTKSNGASEIVEEKGCGVVLEKWDDAPALAEAIERCFAPDATDSMRKRAVEAASELTLERNAAETISVFEAVLCAKQSASSDRSSGISLCGPFGHAYVSAVRLLLARELPPGWEWVSSSAYSVVAKSCAPRKVYYKEFLPRSRFERLKAFFNGSRLQRAKSNGELLRKKGFHSPEILCWGACGRRELMLTEGADATGLSYFMDSNFKTPLTRNELAAKRDLLAKLGREIGRMHRTGIVHGDLRPNNVLVENKNDGPIFHFIDNERNRQFHEVPLRLVEKNLVQMNLLNPAFATLQDRLRFFSAYCESYGRFGKLEARALARAVHRKSLQRLRNKARRKAEEE